MTGRRNGDGEFTYIMTSYQAPEQIYTLVRRLRSLSPDCNIVVSHDCKGEKVDRAVLSRLGSIYLQTAEPIYWGDGSYLRSVLSVLRHVDTGRDDHWYTLITAQDYPLRPLTEYEEHLRSVKADALMEGPSQGDYYDFLLDRYRSYSTAAPGWLGRPPWQALATKTIRRIPGVTLHPQPHERPPRIDIRRLRTPFGPEFELHKGCDLFAINGRALRVLLSSPPSLLKYYERTRIPSESYPHTVLFNDNGLRIVPELIHYMQWEGNHPRWISPQDIDAASSSGRWFARKFTPASPALRLLDQLIDKNG